MKKALAFLAALAVMPLANADGDHGHKDGGFSHNAEFRTRYTYNQNPGLVEDTSSGLTESRVKFDTTFKRGEKFSAKLGLIHNATFGQTPSTPAAASVPVGSESSAGLPLRENTTENQLLVNEAYGTWMASDELMFKVGRSRWTVGNGSVISENDFQQVPFSFEGLWAHYDTDFAKFEAFALKLFDFRQQFDAGTGAAGTVDAEDNIYGINVVFKSLPDILKNSNLHVFGRAADAADTDLDGNNDTVNYSELRYAVNLGGEMSGFHYDLTYAGYSGESELSGATTDTEGSMIHLNLGYKMPEVMGLKVYAIYHMDSGDDNDASNTDTESGYTSFAYDIHNYAGMMDIVRFGNLTYYGVGFGITPMDNLEVTFQYLTFESTEANDANTYGTVTGGSFAPTEDVATDGDTAIGQEIDLLVTKKYDGGFMLGARAGMFMSGDRLTDGTNPIDETITEFQLTAAMTF